MDEHFLVKSILDQITFPEEMLLKMSETPSISFRYFVADNPKTPTDILTILSFDASPLVRKTAKYNLKNRRLIEVNIKSHPYRSIYKRTQSEDNITFNWLNSLPKTLLDMISFS